MGDERDEGPAHRRLHQRLGQAGIQVNEFSENYGCVSGWVIPGSDHTLKIRSVSDLISKTGSDQKTGSGSGTLEKTLVFGLLNIKYDH